MISLNRRAKRSWSTPLAIALAFLWFVLVIALSSRNYFLVNYGAMRIVDRWLEPFGSTLLADFFAFGTILVWLGLLKLSKETSSSSRSIARAKIYIAVSLLPGIEYIASWSADTVGINSIWNVFWLCAWTGLSFAELARTTAGESSKSEWLWFALVCFLSMICAIGWTQQSYEYYDSFMLGFNDFGHFMQRVSNTADGQGLLRETPVLPAFWDHFNPGLLLLVPLWKLFPDVTLAFYLQSISLAGSAILVWKIARTAGHHGSTAVLWAAAWLCQPVLGQMNLAYTYGWHPISLAIPLLLLTVLCIQKRWTARAIVSTLLALSIEEGVFVIAALFCAVNAVTQYGCFNSNRMPENRMPENQIQSALPWQTWGALSVVISIGFFLVFRYSGLAEFQTARFASLGKSPLEVLFSPIMRPQVFWNQLLSSKSGYFLLGLCLPCFLPSLLRGWRILVAAALPLGVLLVWEHRPAQSLAFQYSSTLLPVLWISSITAPSIRERVPSDTPDRWYLPSWNSRQAAMGAFATAWTLSLFLGQFPYSSITLQDVELRTYEPTELGTRLKPGAADNLWLREQVVRIRKDREEVLATGRIASHCVGNRDVETVGQYVQRREKLAKLTDRLDKPILHYRWVILDRLEGFQQNAQEIEAVEREAIQAGFVKFDERYGIIVFRNPK